MVDVIVPDDGVAGKHEAGVFAVGNLVVFDGPVIGIQVVGMNTTLGHVADDEIPDGHIVDVLVVRPERRLRAVARPPAAAVEDRAVLADEGVARFGVMALVTNARRRAGSRSSRRDSC